MGRRAAAAFAFVLALLAIATPASASPGDLDPSFGQGGIGSLNLPYSGTIAAMPDGSIITVRSGYNYDAIALVRTTAAGVDDKSFGDRGFAQIQAAGRVGKQITSLALSPSGNIAIAGVAGEYQGEDALVAMMSPS